MVWVASGRSTGTRTLNPLIKMGGNESTTIRVYWSHCCQLTVDFWSTPSTRRNRIYFNCTQIARKERRFAGWEDKILMLVICITPGFDSFS